MLQASVIISTCMTHATLASVLLTPHLYSFFFHRCSRRALDFLSTRNSPAPNWLRACHFGPNKPFL